MKFNLDKLNSIAMQDNGFIQDVEKRINKRKTEAQERITSVMNLRAELAVRKFRNDVYDGEETEMLYDEALFEKWLEENI